MKVVVLGDGLLGTEIVKQTNWDYFSRKKDNLNITNIVTWSHLLLPYDVIVNCIAYTKTYDSNKQLHWDINYKAVSELVDYCNNHNKKLIHISTDEVYGSLELDSENKFTEQTLYSPNSPYSASKAASDHFVNAWRTTYGVPTIITNCSNNYGPSQHIEKFIPKVIAHALEDVAIPVYGTGDNVRDWLYVEDHCHAINLVLKNGKVGQKYNIGGGVELSNLELVKKILKMMGKPETLIKFVDDRLGHDKRYAIDYAKIEKELKYEPLYSLEEGLQRTIEWIKNGNKT